MRIARHRRWMPAAIVSALLLSAGGTHAQDGVVQMAYMTSEAGLTVEHVDQLRHEAAQTPGIDDATRKAIDDAYQAAIAHLKSAAGLAERAAAFEVDAAKVNERVAEVRRLLEEASKEAAPAAAAGDLATLEQDLAQQELTLASQRKKHAALEAEPQARLQRRKEVRARLAALAESLSTGAEDAAIATQLDHPAVAAAKSVEGAALRIARDQELLALKSELAGYDAEDAVDLVRLKTDLAAKRLVRIEHTVGALAVAVKTKREAAAKESVRQARLEAIRATPVLKSHAERNHALAETDQATTEKLSQAENELAASQEAYEALQKQFRLTRKKIEAVGLTSSIGALLRKQRATLPDPTVREAAIATRQTLIDETQYESFDYSDEREELSDLDEKIHQIVTGAALPNESDRASLSSASQELLERKRDYLDSLLKNSQKYFETLVELDTSDRQIVALTHEYAEFIDERVLWIRSGRMLSSSFSLDDSDRMLASGVAWKSSALNFYHDLLRAPAGYAAGLILFGSALILGRRLRKRVTAAGLAAEKANCRTLAPTLNALAATVALALVWPLGCAALGWRLEGFSDDLTRAIGGGLNCMGLLWAPVEIFRQVCRAKGLGESHFGWSPSVTHLLRHRLRRFTLVCLPVVFVTAMLLSLDSTHGSDTVERITFITGSLICAIFMARTLSPGGVLREYLAYNKGNWADRLRWAWPVLGAATPVALGALAFVGYYYTAQVLAWRVFATCCFLATIVVLRNLMLRALMLRRRNLSIEQAKARAAEAAAATADTGGGEGVVAGIVTGPTQADLVAQSQQTRRLLTAGMFATAAVGLWLIWVQVLPALGMLDRYPLWKNATVAAAAPSETPSMSPAGMTPAMAESSPTDARHSAEQSVTTLSDLGFAILVAFVTFVLARNGPGLLEMSVLQQLPLEASVRYAITTLVSYAIVLIGVIVSCSSIGLQWSQIQWLATALTFGLAFGLQEMFANFVAGLIILLERPIRVGDIVTVDDVTGVVSKIRIRATSITNWDRKEYVVPNKEFITGRLLNWTLSDKINRIVVNVGVAYGTDTERAREILLQVANDHPLILKDPQSVATFEGFGDNSLNLVLRTYLPTLDNRLEVIHHLHTRINQAFAAEGIEISFPQRDLHIRSLPAGLGLALGGEQSRQEENPAQQGKEAA